MASHKLLNVSVISTDNVLQNIKIKWCCAMNSKYEQLECFLFGIVSFTELLKKGNFFVHVLNQRNHNSKHT